MHFSRSPILSFCRYAPNSSLNLVPKITEKLRVFLLTFGNFPNCKSIETSRLTNLSLICWKVYVYDRLSIQEKINLYSNNFLPFLTYLTLFKSDTSRIFHHVEEVALWCMRSEGCGEMSVTTRVAKVAAIVISFYGRRAKALLHHWSSFAV